MVGGCSPGKLTASDLPGDPVMSHCCATLPEEQSWGGTSTWKCLPCGSCCTLLSSKKFYQVLLKLINHLFRSARIKNTAVHIDLCCISIAMVSSITAKVRAGNTHAQNWCQGWLVSLRIQNRGEVTIWWVSVAARCCYVTTEYLFKAPVGFSSESCLQRKYVTVCL